MEYVTPAQSEKDDLIDYYKNKRNDIKSYFSKKLDERIQMLKSMTYDDWIRYNKGNKLMTFDNHDYYLFVWEANIDSSAIARHVSFVNKVDENNMYENVSYNDIQTTLNDEIKIIKYNVDPDLIKNMYFSKNPVNVMSYYWLDKNRKSSFENDDVVQKESITKVFEKNGVSGVIGISYNIENISLFDSYKFYEVIDKPSLFLIIGVTFILSYFLSYMIKNENSINYYLPIVFLYILNAYILHFLNDKTQRVNSDALNQKFQDISSSTLSIAFLISVNTFFIDYMGKHNKQPSDIYNCNIILFCFSILILLASLYKITSYSHGYDIRNVFLVQQLLYNLVIIINGLITVTYLSYVIVGEN